MKETAKRLQKIRSHIKRLKNPETIAIYQIAENRLNRHLIETEGLYYNSQDQFIKITDLHILHLTNILKRLDRIDHEKIN